ncbi:MAG: CAP domain-containing protein [Solirubrobacterales bacterium]
MHISPPGIQSCIRARGTLVAIAAIAVAVSAGAGAPSAAAAGCPNADLAPGDAAQAALAQTAARCLVNRERRKRGRRSLRFNGNLLESSTWQAQDMVDHAYFDHQRSGGPSFTARITRFGYGENSNGFSLGENIAWASASTASAREIVRMWMHSPGHKANILRGPFREQAIAAVWVNGDEVGGEYAGAGPVVIYVNQFGTRY